MRFHLSLGILLALWFAASSAGCGTSRMLAGQDKPLTDADLAMAFSDRTNRAASDFSEQLVTRVQFEGGAAYVRLLVSNLAMANGAADVKLRFALPDGRIIEDRVRKKKDDWTFGDSAFQATVGDNRFDIDTDSVDITIKTKKIAATLSFPLDIPPVRPAGGSADFGSGKYYATTLITPRSRVTVNIELPPAEPGGEPEQISLDGIAHIVHRAGNIAPYAMARRWFNVEESDSERTILMSIFQRTERYGGETQGWFVYATDDEVVACEPSVTLKTSEPSKDEKTGYEVPMLIEVGAGKPQTLSGTFRAVEFLQRSDDLRSLGKMERFVVERLMKPWTFRHRSEYELKVTPPAGEDGQVPEPRILTGEATYTYQQLR